MFFDVKSEIPKTRFQSATFVKRIQDAIAEEVGGEARMSAEKTIVTWNNKPDVVVETTARGTRLKIGNVKLGNRSKPIWKYLDQGTAVRYATMTKGFRAKTRPGYLVSYAGAGRLAYVSTKVPRPGIAPRRWSESIQSRGRKAIQAGVRKAIRDGLLDVAGK